MRRKNIIYVSIGAVASVLVVKGVVKARREAKYSSTGMASSDISKQSAAYYDNLAHVKPGFPLPNNEQGEDERQRKSEFEGPGMSVLSRRSGDRLGLFNWGKDK